MGADGHGALIARAKSLAVPVASCVAASLRLDHLLPGLSREELTALVVVLAEGADPVRLREVCRAHDDGIADPVDRAEALRKAHAETRRLHRAGLEVPFRLRVLDSEYREAHRKQVLAAEAGRLRVPGGSPEVAAAIRQARKQAGLSQARLAAVLGVTETAIQHWEYAKRTPSGENWVQLQLALGPLGIVRERTLDPETTAREASDAAA